MTKIHIDFETRSEVDIWEVGAWLYSTHPSTEVQCIGYAVDDRPVQIIPKELVGDPVIGAMFMLYIEELDSVYTAHNAYFERCIWKNIMEKKFGLLPIPLQRWRCTQAKACAYGLPKALEKAADAMRIEQRKDKAGAQMMKRMCKPLPNKKGEVIYDEDPEHYKSLYEYCRQDVRTERDLDNALPDLNDQEQEIWFYDQLINTRGLHIDMPTVKNIIKILEGKTNSLNKELVALTKGVITKGTQTVAMLAFLNKGGAKMTSIDKQSVLEAMKDGRLTKDQTQILRLRQQLGKSSLAKYTKLVHAVDSEGVLRDSFVYHGASTGRWTGKMVQLQNLDANKQKIDTDQAIAHIDAFGYPAVEMMYPGKIMETLAACIRGMIVPDKGKELYVVDYGAIEARVVMWLAGEERGLEEFKATDAGTDEDIYVKMAQRIYNNSNLTKAANPSERQLGKQAILGCGFGMGAVKFKATCAGYGIIISDSEATRIIDLYRTAYYNVKNYWYDMERAMLQAYERPGELAGCRGIGWIYIKERDTVFCRLPSERILTYMRPKMEENRFGNMGMTFMTEVTGQWVRRDTYGGLLVENIVQATARDIMAYSIPRLEQAGFPTLMHTHDEIVSERAVGEGKIQEMIDLMCIRPKWASTCPIVAEGFVTQRYKKG